MKSLSLERLKILEIDYMDWLKKHHHSHEDYQDYIIMHEKVKKEILKRESILNSHELCFE